MPTSRIRRRRTFRKRRRLGGGSLVMRRHRPMTTGRVKKIIGAELKFVSTNFRDAFTAAIPVLLNLSNMPQGDNNSQREGNRITPVNIHGHITVVGESAQTTDVTDIRLAIFRWNEDIEATANPLAEEIMQNVAELGSSYNINNRGQFKILWSRYFTVVNNPDNSAFRRTLRFYVKLSGPKVLFDVNQPKKFHYFFMALSNSAEIADPQMILNTTFRYTDS